MRMRILELNGKEADVDADDMRLPARITVQNLHLGKKLESLMFSQVPE